MRVCRPWETLPAALPWAPGTYQEFCQIPSIPQAPWHQGSGQDGGRAPGRWGSGVRIKLTYNGCVARVLGEAEIWCDPLLPTPKRWSQFCPRQGPRRITSRQKYSIYVFMGPLVQHTASPGTTEDLALWPRLAFLLLIALVLEQVWIPHPRLRRGVLPRQAAWAYGPCSAGTHALWHLPLSLAGDSHDNWEGSHLQCPKC